MLPHCPLGAPPQPKLAFSRQPFRLLRFLQVWTRASTQLDLNATKISYLYDCTGYGFCWCDDSYLEAIVDLTQRHPGFVATAPYGLHTLLANSRVF